MYDKHDNTNKLYAVWSAMKQRCTNSNHKKWERYGGRGISVCVEWKDSYDNFKVWALSNGYREWLTLDRIDNNKGYEPSNCRWTTYHEQNLNTSRSVHIEYKGEVHTPQEWADLYGLKLKAIYNRMERTGVSFIEALLSVGEKRERLITYRGKTQNLRQWSDELGISYTCLINRLNCSHLSVKEAFEKPYVRRKSRKSN